MLMCQYGAPDKSYQTQVFTGSTKHTSVLIYSHCDFHVIHALMPRRKEVITVHEKSPYHLAQHIKTEAFK